MVSTGLYNFLAHPETRGVTQHTAAAYFYPKRVDLGVITLYPALAQRVRVFRVYPSIYRLFPHRAIPRFKHLIVEKIYPLHEY